MKFQSTAIHQIADIICSEKLNYNCTIIIGDNSSGKSFLVKELVNRWKENFPVYFIDAVNRGFQVTKVTSTKEKPEYRNTIVNTRLREEYFNMQDSFSCYGTSTERADIKLIIDQEGKVPVYEYNNLVVELFAEKLKGKSREDVLKICEPIYIIGFLTI